MVCIGRARLRHSDGLAAAEAGYDFNVSPLAEYTDVRMTEDEMQTAERYVNEIDELSQQYILLKTRLQALDAQREPVVAPAIPGQRQEVGRGHRLKGEGEQTLRQRTAERHDVLVRYVASEDPSAMRGLHALWDVEGERAAELQLASFASCSYFGPITRLRAAQCQGTLERLRLARGGLRKLKQTEAAKLALRKIEIVS